MNLTWKKHTLKFNFEAKTSRNTLLSKDTWYIIDKETKAIGECSPIQGLSIDKIDDYSSILDEICNPKFSLSESFVQEISNQYPAIALGLETLTLDNQSLGSKILFPSKFTEGKSSLLINGLIWMGNFDFMLSQIDLKLAQGFDCLKLKIGAIDFESELELIRYIRAKSPSLTIRLDANGAFGYEEAIEKLNVLSQFNIHSIEQPIKASKYTEMSKLIKSSPIEIALDEDLIGISDKLELLKELKPHYIVLKPSLLGGFNATSQWIKYAETLNIRYWITSALESNVGLNAISQFTYLNTPDFNFAQGLGTGSLYSNNIDSSLEIIGEKLNFNPTTKWNLDNFIQL